MTKTLKALGTTQVRFFAPEDECPHQPGEEELWQESWVIFFWDRENEVYVLLRVSQEPNKLTGGTHTVWLNAWAPGVQYRNVNTELNPGEGEITKDGIRVANGLCGYRFDGRHIWRVEDGATKMELTMTDDHPGAAYFNESAEILSNTLQNHVEAVGVAEGKVTIDGRTYRVSGPAWRDHSWGKRHWLSVRGHRAFHAIMENDMSFFSLVMIGEDGSHARNALVMQGDTVEYTQDFRVTAFVDEDCVSNRGGLVELSYGGKRYELELTGIPRASVHLHHGLACVDTMCHVTMGDIKGVGFSETSHRAQGGDQEPHMLPNSFGYKANGVFRE